MPAIALRWLQGVEGSSQQAVARAAVQSRWQRVRQLVAAALIGVGVMERGAPRQGGWRF